MKFCMFVCIKVLILHSQTETKRDLGGVGYKAGAALPLWPAVGVQILAIIYMILILFVDHEKTNYNV